MGSQKRSSNRAFVFLSLKIVFFLTFRLAPSDEAARRNVRRKNDFQWQKTEFYSLVRPVRSVNSRSDFCVLFSFLQFLSTQIPLPRVLLPLFNDDPIFTQQNGLLEQPETASPSADWSEIVAKEGEWRTCGQRRASNMEREGLCAWKTDTCCPNLFLTRCTLSETKEPALFLATSVHVRGKENDITVCAKPNTYLPGGTAWFFFFRSFFMFSVKQNLISKILTAFHLLKKFVS